MALTQRREFKAFMRVAAVMLIGAGLSACSTVPDWVDPTSWMGPDTPAQAGNGQYPDLSAIPDRPDAGSSGRDQAAVADSLAAARSHVQYSAESLRGGTEAAAPPPEPQAAATVVPPPTQSRAEPETSDESSQAAAAPAPEPTRTAMAEAPAAAPPPAPAPAPAGPVPGAQPAMPAGNAVAFQPSKAPPLDASVSQFVPAPIIQRYAETGSVANAPAAGSSGSVRLKAPPGTRKAALGTRQTNVGGPEGMSGSVVADLGAVGGPRSVYVSANGMAPVAVVLFSGNSSGLNAAGRAQVRAAVAAYKARGRRGYIRVVGHSSSRTGPMSLVRHMEANFKVSQARAKSVARALIRAGVPADKVLVDAVGDSQPVYRESMPSGEDGNRRAEIFLQG